MKKTLLFALLLSVWNAAAVWADGEERNDKGTRWVDPVEFYELQDINRTDFKSDYDQGDIDFNKELKKKGVKVYGLRLKPIAGAAWVEKYLFVFSERECFMNGSINYQNLYGVKGAPIHEASFCVYVDEPVSCSYSFDYTWNNTVSLPPRKADMKKGPESNSVTSNVEININNLLLSPMSDGGVGLNYSLTASVIDKTASGKFHYCVGMRDSDGVMTHDRISKSSGVDEKYGKFIYFKGARELLVMLSANHATPAIPEPLMTGESQEALSNHPWARVYFIVEEILVEDTGGVPALTELDKEELTFFAEDLLAWLKGEGDPLGLGEHTDAMESAVINTLSTVVALLLGTGLASVAGSTGAEIVSGLTSALVNGTVPPPAPAPVPNVPRPPTPDMIKPRRPEDEDDNEEEEQNPFESGPYSNLFNQFVKQDEDGDLHVKDPVTGKDTLYINTGDGTWKNFTTGQDWTTDELGARIGYRNDNKGELQKDAETAARNVAEQRAQWDAQNERDRERGYSDDQKDFMDWKKAQEEQLQKEMLIDKLALQYHVTNTEKAVKDAIQFEKMMNEIEAKTQQDLAKQWDQGANRLDVVDKTCDAGVNVLAACIPGAGPAVKNVYTFSKETLVATSEAIANRDKMGLTGGVAHIVVGMGKGALGVIQNEAGNLTQNAKMGFVKEYAITVGTEASKDAMTKYYETGDIGKAIDAAANAAGKKSTEFFVSKTINVGFETLRGGSADYVALVKDGSYPKDWGAKGASMVNNFLNNPKATTIAKGIVKDGDVLEAVINEGLVKGGAYDLSGELAKEGVDFVREIGKFNEKAASFRKARLGS